ncbi:hypothetical protein GW17_00037739 [Ensete ventricosum]|nr:hypothetical protein GW17_00037739 [Ensete ventricosum]
MKIQCNACEAAEAVVLCCADEAALCWACDKRVHAANKLAGKHQRVSLLSDGSGGSGSSTRGVPKCDICQVLRVLLLRPPSCDLAIHTANPYVCAHQRFLVTGVRVGLDPTEPVAPAASPQFHAPGRVVASQSEHLPAGTHLMSSSETNTVSSSHIANQNGGTLGSKAPLYGFSMSETILDWPLEHFFGFPDFNQNFGFTEHSASKADSGKHGSSEGSPTCRSTDDDRNADECLGQVPEIPPPPTASGLSWQRNRHYPASNKTVVVPDICSLDDPNSFNVSARSKRRRRQSSGGVVREALEEGAALGDLTQRLVGEADEVVSPRPHHGPTDGTHDVDPHPLPPVGHDRRPQRPRRVHRCSRDRPVNNITHASINTADVRQQ